MKKLLAFLLAVAMLASMATMTFAAETTTTKSTTLTTTVPAATYTLNIPEDQTIPYGQTITEIGQLSISDGAGFGQGKNVEVTVTHSDFVSEAVSTTIPFQIDLYSSRALDSTDSMAVPSGTALTFAGKRDGTVAQYCTNGNSSDWGDITKITVASADWGKALAGEYTATITFAAEVVVE